MGRPRRFSPEVRERAVRLVMEQRPAHPPEWAALQAVAPKLGTTAETLWKWVRQAERDTGQRPGLTTSERERLTALERENRELTRTDEILKSASAFFALAALDCRITWARWWRTSMRIGTASGASRSAEPCRSPRRRITAIGGSRSSRHADRRERAATRHSVLRFSVCGTSSTRSTARARCGST